MEINSENIESKIGKIMHVVFNEGAFLMRNDPSRVKKLRVSSFPFCAVQWFVGLPGKTSKFRSMGTEFKFYTSVGTAVHDTVQSILASLDIGAHKVEMIADWGCRKCSHMQFMQVKPLKCEKCGFDQFNFHEVTVKDGILEGHIDTIFEFSVKPSKKYPEGKAWVVVDYKTTSTEKIGTDKLVNAGYKAQIRSYVAILHRLKKPVLPFAVLVFIPRDDPLKLQPVVVKVDYESQLTKIDNYKKQFNIVTSVKSAGDLQEVVDNRPCSQGCLKQFEWCQWRNMCAGPENDEVILKELNNIRKVVKHRLPIKDWKP